MSDQLARLTDKHRSKFQEHINKKTNLIGKCPTCSSRSWALLDHFVNLPLFYTDGSARLGGTFSYPNVGIICENCGNTQLINAVKAGILDGHPSTPQPAETKGGGDDGK